MQPVIAVRLIPSALGTELTMAPVDGLNCMICLQVASSRDGTFPS